MGKRKGKKSTKLVKGEGDQSTHSAKDSSKHSKYEEHDMNVTENSDDVNSPEPYVEIGQQRGLLSEGPPHAIQEKGPAMPPWLTSPVVRMGQRIASLPPGFDMDASFSSNRSANFDTPSVATDIDDDIRRRTSVLNDDVNSATSAEKLALAKDLSNQGIGLFVDVDVDDASLGNMSELSTSNQSYILDLAMQKESRDKNLKEEALEEALILFKQARKAGHGSEAFFLIIVAEVQKKLEESKAELFRLQDERLNQALDEELKRQKEECNLSGSSLRSGKGGRQQRVSVYMEKEKSRRSMDPTMLESSAAAASEATDDSISIGEYDWADVHESQAVAKKKKAKSKQSKTSKKAKPPKSEKPKTKKKRNKSVDESIPTEREPLSQMTETEVTKSSHDESNSAHESIHKTPSSSKHSDKKKESKKSKKKKNKSKESKKAKKTEEGEEEKPSSTESTHQTTESKDDESEIAETTTCTDSVTRLKCYHHAEDPSPPDSQDLDGSAHVIREQGEENRDDPDNNLDVNMQGGNPSVTRKNAAKLKRHPSASTAIHNLLTTVFRRKGQGTEDSQTPKRVGFFKKKKQRDVDDDPSIRLLPLTGSQLQ